MANAANAVLNGTRRRKKRRANPASALLSPPAVQTTQDPTQASVLAPSGAVDPVQPLAATQLLGSATPPTAEVLPNQGGTPTAVPFQTATRNILTGKDNIFAGNVLGKDGGVVKRTPEHQRLFDIFRAQLDKEPNVADPSLIQAAPTETRAEQLNRRFGIPIPPSGEAIQGSGNVSSLINIPTSGQVQAAGAGTTISEVGLATAPNQAAPTARQGQITIGGPKGGEVTIPSAQVGTERGKALAETGAILGEADGSGIPTIRTTQDQGVVADKTTGRMLETRTEETPIDHFLNQGARDRARDTADITGRATQADIKAGMGGKNLATFMLPTAGKHGLSEQQRRKNKRADRAKVTAVLGGARTPAEKAALKAALDEVDKRYARSGKKRVRSLIEQAQGTGSFAILHAQNELVLAEGILQDATLKATRESLDSGQPPSAASLLAVENAAIAVQDSESKLAFERQSIDNVNKQVMRHIPPSVKRAMEKSIKVNKAWLAAKGNATIFTGIEKALESFVEGTVQSFGKTGNIKKGFAAGKGSVVSGRGFFAAGERRDKQGNTLKDKVPSGTGGSEFRPGEITVANLNTTWKMLQQRYGPRGVPDSVLAIALAGMMAKHDEWPEKVKRDFMMGHKDIFQAQLQTPVRGGGRTPKGTIDSTGAKTFTVDEIVEAAKKKSMSEEMAAYFTGLTESEKAEIRAKARS